MKLRFTFLLFLASFLSFAQTQDFDRDLQYQTEYMFELAANNATLAILKYDSPSLKETSLVLTTEVEACKRFDGLTLYLASGEELSFKNSVIDCEKLDSGKSKLTSSLLLTDELIKKMSESDLLGFNIGTVAVKATFKEEGENFQLLFKFAKIK